MPQPKTECQKKAVHIIGTGPAGMMAGFQLLKQSFSVHFYDHKKSAGRKFLVAGKGGFNITHSQELTSFIGNYSHDFIKDAVKTFTNNDTVDWLAEIGIPTYVGSSGKIFPEKGIKPVEVLAALKNNLLENGATFHFQQELIDFNASELIFKNANETINVPYLHAIFALGGGSWKKTGSDGNWQHLFEQKGIEIIPFQSSNAGMICEHWDPQLEGTIIKNCLVQFGGSSKKGEVRFTKYGLEGAPIYALNHAFRNGAATLNIDLKPSLSDDKIKSVLADKGQNRSQQLETLKLPKGVIRYLKSICSKEDYLDDEKIFHVIKNLPFKIKELRPVDEAISTVGGISMNSITNDFRLKNHPTCYCIGEMLDWDAPTGGYLLQACFSSGFVAGKTIVETKTY